MLSKPLVCEPVYPHERGGFQTIKTLCEKTVTSEPPRAAHVCRARAHPIP